MIDALFEWLSIALEGSMLLAISAAFGWGILSVLLSPCHLAGIPLIIGYISQHSHTTSRKATTLAFTFALGSLVSVTAIGLITVWAGSIAGDTGNWGNYLLGTLFLVMGLFLMDLLPKTWNNLRPSEKQQGGLTGALTLGLIMGIALGPCTFAFFAPVLGTVFAIATHNQPLAIIMVSAFAFGHILVVAIAGSTTSLVQRYLDWSGKSSLIPNIKRLCGAIVFCFGLYTLISTLCTQTT